jgi:hypothetical protein
MPLPRLLRRSAFAVAFTTLAVLSPSVHADDVPAPPGWKVSTRSPETAVFYRYVEQAHAREYRGVGDVDAPPGTVFAVVTDVEAHPKFMPFTIESTIVQRRSPTELVAHQVISPPMISARDAYMVIVTTPGSGPTDTWKSAWHAVPDFGPELPGRVRLQVAEGTWLFEPLDGGARTHITYTALTNIGGSVPGWMADMSTGSVVKDLFAAIRKRVRALSAS